jgi:signal transduction histidine kinase
MDINPRPPPPERGHTDSSLSDERKKADDELAIAGNRVEYDADNVVRHAREQADETLSEARTRADAMLTSTGASSDVMAVAHAEQAEAGVVLARERRTADHQLEKERERRHRQVAKLLHLERAQTDRHLSLERARSDDGVMHLLEELAEAAKVRDEFLSLASHELRTPLTPLTLGLDLLAREVGSVPDSPHASRMKSQLAAVRRQVQRLSSIVEHLIDVSLISSGNRPMTTEAVDLALVVRNVVDALQGKAEKADGGLDVDAVGVTGEWDKVRLAQTVSSLLENAIKYGAGKPIRVRLEALSDRARLTVQDGGIGIAPEYVARIFERFERAVPPGHYSGLGLGLHICRANVEGMGGTIAVNSELGRGSTFTIELPLSGRTGT